ncbi:hypothetical protein B0H14DRAFT_3869893 [Mycena olivaceomarginata]|nr:hypothetical protein B0H14DRAFT_3869893 [Mycena olivaceomarginata]
MHFPTSSPSPPTSFNSVFAPGTVFPMGDGNRASGSSVTASTPPPQSSSLYAQPRSVFRGNALSPDPPQLGLSHDELAAFPPHICTDILATAARSSPFASPFIAPALLVTPPPSSSSSAVLHVVSTAPAPSPPPLAPSSSPVDPEEVRIAEIEREIATLRARCPAVSSTPSSEPLQPTFSSTSSTLPAASSALPTSFSLPSSSFSSALAPSAAFHVGNHNFDPHSSTSVPTPFSQPSSPVPPSLAPPLPALHGPASDLDAPQLSLSYAELATLPPHACAEILATAARSARTRLHSH